MVDPTTLDNLIDFVDLYSTGYDLNKIKEYYPIFENINKVLESSTRFAYTFIFDIVKERLQYLSKDFVEKLVDKVWISYISSSLPVYTSQLTSLNLFDFQVGVCLHGCFIRQSRFDSMAGDGNGSDGDGKTSDGNGKGSDINGNDLDGTVNGSEGAKDSCKDDGGLSKLNIIQDSYINIEKVDVIVVIKNCK